MSDFDHIMDLFRQEAGEHLAALEKGFLDLEGADSAAARGPIINRQFRAAHSLKGAARAVELIDLQDSAQELEETLDALRENPAAVSGDAIARGLAQFDELRKVFDQWQQLPVSTKTAEAATTLAPVDASDDAFTVRVSSTRLDHMLSLAGELRISQRAANLQAQQLRELSLAKLRLSLDDKTGVENPQSQIDSFLDRLKRIQADMHKRRIREELLVEALEGDIHEARLLPLSMLAESLRRTVRDLAQSLGKAIRYEIDVGTVLLDKAVIEDLRDPLLHMVRNAAYHGLETPAERQSAGKPAEGLILLRAQRHGDRVQIYLCDDGRGIDFERIRDRLRQSRELADAEIDELGQRELAAYLFRPGFTTSAEKDAISGRGVGLDVAYEALRRLHGSVELLPAGEELPSGGFRLPVEEQTAAGPRYATIFRIAVPVTISTVRILTVSSGGEYYGIPSSAIVRTARIRSGELRELEGSLILTVDGNPVPWVLLADLVGSPPGPSRDHDRGMPYVLTSHDGKRLAVGVDDVEDESEVILKPLGFPLTGMAGIVGGTIRPDGSVQIVLDVASPEFRPQRLKSIAAARRTKPAARILVVDDSPTTRAIVRGVLAAAGYSVRTASDGVDALERLRNQPVDLVVSDVQMPRMNGLELTRQIKSRFGLPVILVTGMEQEEHRREGLAAGADAYVVKSLFEGEGLLEIVQQFV